MTKAELRKIIYEEIAIILERESFGLPVHTYRDFSLKFHNKTIKYWALFAHLYEKDIIKAKSEHDLKQRERDVLPKLPRPDMKEAYRMFLLYRRDVLRGLEKESVIKEFIATCRAYYVKNKKNEI